LGPDAAFLNLTLSPPEQGALLIHQDTTGSFCSIALVVVSITTYLYESTVYSPLQAPEFSPFQDVRSKVRQGCWLVGIWHVSMSRQETVLQLGVLA
jgi:hypothetical protein